MDPEPSPGPLVPGAEPDLPGDPWRERQMTDIAEIVRQEIFIHRVRVDRDRVCRTLTMQAASGLKMKRSYARSGCGFSCHRYPIRSANFFASAIAATGFLPRVILVLLEIRD